VSRYGQAVPRARRPAKGNAQSRLAHFRRARGITQHELAAAIGISPKTYWRLEHGQLSEPSLRLLVNCAMTLRVPLNELIEPEWREWFVYDERRRRPPKPSDFGRFAEIADP
jgi:transcriptional regulator with XRE-family HTH domain